MTARADGLQARLNLPPDHLARIVGSMRLPAILESGPGFGDAGRWSIYAAEPRCVFRSEGDGWAIHRGEDRDFHAGDPLVGLARLLSDFSGACAPPAEFPEAGGAHAPQATGRAPDVSPFDGGWIGFFGYDLATRLERLPRKSPPDSRIPDVEFGLYDTFVVYDHRDGSATLHVEDLTGSGASDVSERYARWTRFLGGPVSTIPPSRIERPIRAGIPRAAYLDSVARALEYIRAGDIFQVNLSQRFEARGRMEPLDLFLRMREGNPAPFAAFLGGEGYAIVSASPEWFYRTRGDKIVTRPIKGTRPRGASDVEDARLIEELRTSAKDRAELTMIVDLERNDLGRVCRYGSVVVSEALTVETYAQVHHLVATVEGRLRAGVAPIDVVRAMFPGGSITGAPKIRAMEIIDELEPNRRNLYTGAIGYFSRCGNSGFNIAIRTMIVEGDRVSYQVGGGIVADSDPEGEYEETLHKGRAMREVLESLERIP